MVASRQRSLGSLSNTHAPVSTFSRAWWHPARSASHAATSAVVGRSSRLIGTRRSCISWRSTCMRCPTGMRCNLSSSRAPRPSASPVASSQAIDPRLPALRAPDLCPQVQGRPGVAASVALAPRQNADPAAVEDDVQVPLAHGHAPVAAVQFFHNFGWQLHGCTGTRSTTRPVTVLSPRFPKDFRFVPAAFLRGVRLAFSQRNAECPLRSMRLSGAAGGD